MLIPAIVCHGIRPIGSGRIPNPLTADHFEALIKITSEMGFESISYDQLAKWQEGDRGLPRRPILIDFDHPVRSLRRQVLKILDRYGFTANLFMYTRPYDPTFERPLATTENPDHMTWKEIRELVAAGWLIGAHTVTHPNLSDLSLTDPDGEMLRRELDRCNEVIQENLGAAPRDFAFPGISWSSLAENEVKKRYRFGRLWVVGSQYLADGESIRYAKLVGMPGADEEDGGPPWAARYVNEETNPYRLPSMDLQALVNSTEAFRKYLRGAIDRSQRA
jgi:peptidoglycan/xylan/chitin deacetylase (PgdA/CDA1 family)